MKYVLFLLLTSPFYCLAQTQTDTTYDHYYVLLQAYQEGKKDYSAMPYIVEKARAIRDRETVTTVAQDYIDNYLMNLPKDQLYKKDNLNFIRFNLQSSKSKAFSIFLKDSINADNVMEEKGAARSAVLIIIAKEEINPVVQPLTSGNTEPDWKGIRQKIQSKYGADLAGRAITDGKIQFYGVRKDWNRYGQQLIEKVDTYGPFGLFTVDVQYNELAWNLFKRTSDKVILEKALSWSDSAIQLAVEPNMEFFDTKANILYKLGRVKEAIEVQEKAAAAAPHLKDIQLNLDKMKRGEATWPNL